MLSYPREPRGSHPTCGASSREGPRYYDGVLTWVDIEGCALHRLDGSHSVERFDAMVGCANPTVDGDIVVALADRIELVGSGEVLARFPHGAISARTTVRATRPAGCGSGRWRSTSDRARVRSTGSTAAGLTTILAA